MSDSRNPFQSAFIIFVIALINEFHPVNLWAVGFGLAIAGAFQIWREARHAR